MNKYFTSLMAMGVLISAFGQAQAETNYCQGGQLSGMTQAFVMQSCSSSGALVTYMDKKYLSSANEGGGGSASTPFSLAFSVPSTPAKTQEAPPQAVASNTSTGGGPSAPTPTPPPASNANSGKTNIYANA